MYRIFNERKIFPPFSLFLLLPNMSKCPFSFLDFFYNFLFTLITAYLLTSFLPVT